MNAKSMFNGHPGLAANPNGGFDEFRQQLLVAMARRLAGPDGVFTIPVTDVDDNGQYIVTMEGDPVTRSFKFSVSKKQ